jgi:anti-anti-sigma factor
MNVKIDTKERFTVITPEEEILSANMTAELKSLLLPYLQKDIPHVILKMNVVKEIDEFTGEIVASIQQEFYEKGCSFVICELQKNVEQLLDEKELLELMNVTPTESEAWDILQMEEIERELTSDENEPN